MSDEELKILEKFILSDNKEEILKEFLSTFDIKLYLEGNHLLSKNPSDSKIEEILKILERNSDLHSKLKLRHLIKLYESSNDSEIANQINNEYLGYNFSYPVPRAAQSEEVEQVPNVPEYETPEIKSATENEKSFNSLTSEGKHQISILNTSDIIFKKLLSESSIWGYSNLPIRFIKYYKEKEFIETECFRNMSLTQLKQISDLDGSIWKFDTFTSEWMKKEYFLKNLYMNDEQKYELMKTIAIEVQENARYNISFKTVILLNVLALEIKLGKCEEKWFISYLNYHRPSDLYITSSNCSAVSMSIFSEFIIDDTLDEERILDYYITTLLFSNPSIEPFKPYLKLEYLKSIQAKVLILKGTPIETIEDYNNYTHLLTSIELEPCPDNPKEFNHKELVKFAMNIKNIPRLLIKVLELNPKNYYLNNYRKIDINIELDGLIAKTEYSYEYNEQPQIRSRKIFEFPELNGKIGMFVIEFFGNGRHSRTLIKKGSLRYISNVTINGHVVYIMNEDNEICKKGAGLYLDSRFFEADSDGKIELPFARSTSEKNLILVHEDSSELIKNFIHQSELYELKTAFIVHKEQLITAAHTNIFIKPRLFVNNIIAPNSLLKESKVIVCTRDPEGSSSVKEYSNLIIPKTGVIEIEIEIPPRIIGLSIKFESIVESTEDIKIPLSSDYDISVNQLMASTTTIGLFLRLNNDEYLLEVRGRNGEPVSRQRIEFILIHLYWKEPIKKSLITDTNGEIHLGKLDNINTLSAAITLENSKTQKYSWELISLKGKIEYPKVIQLCEGDEFGIPAQLDSIKLSDEILFFSQSFNYIIDDAIHHLNYDPESFMLFFTGLDPGVYLLTFKKTLVDIEIHVVEGMHFHNDFILKENSVIVGNNQYNSIGIKDIQLDGDYIKVKVSGYDENTIVYGLFFNYLTSDLLSIIKELQKLKETPISQVFEFDRPENYYLPSNKLDEEYQYVLNRSNFPRFVGNILPKPQILLKRVLVGDTSTETQTAKRVENTDRNYNKIAYMDKTNEKYEQSELLSMETELNIPLEFLKYDAKIIHIPLSNKEVMFKIPGIYASAFIIASNNSNLAYRLFSLPNQVPIKDIRSKSSNSEYNELCKFKSVFKGETFVLEDFPNTKLKIIESLEDLYYAVKAFMVAAQDESESELGWDFLLNWPSLPLSKKLEIYDEYASHELNLFLYKRDKNFFETVVKPFVQSKMKKDLIDLYICGESLDEWTSIDCISRLNYLEIALVIDRIKDTNIDIANALVQMLKDAADSQKLTIEDTSRIIEVILRFNGTLYKDLRIHYYQDATSENFEGEDKDEYEDEEEEEEQGEKIVQKPMEYESFSAMPHKESADRKIIENIFYKKIESTKEFSETYYHNNPPEFKCKDIKLARLYYELAQSFLNNSSWLSDSFLVSTSNIFQIMPIMSYAAVPFTPEKHEYKSDGKIWSIKAHSPMLLLYKELTKAQIDLNPQIFIAVKYFEQGKKIQVKQFVKEKPYSCKLVITNTFGRDSNFSILTQIPEGSIPLDPPYYSKTYLKYIPNYTTRSLNFSFYFPQSGIFTHNPGNQAVNNKIISKADTNTITVLDTYDISVLETFKDLVNSGRKDLIIEFLNRENIQSCDKEFYLKDIYWMLRQKEFWKAVIDIYRKKFLYDDVLWSFGFYHNDRLTISEIIKSNMAIRKKLGHFFQSEIIKTQNEDFKHLEFDPLVNARTYKLGNHERITNQRFKEVYKDYLYYLSEKINLNNEDFLCLVQYFILQERYDEAKNLYQKITMTPSSGKIITGPLQLQYDYITCYLDLEAAKITAPLYADYPVSTWSKKFKEVIALIQEFDSKDILQSKNIDKEPSLDFKIEDNSIILNYENVQSCTIRIYKIDLEILFSKNPFLIQNTHSFSYVKANHEFNLDLSGNTHRVPLNEYKGKNIFIEADYKTYSISKSYFSNNLITNCIQRFGQIKVMDLSRKPRPAAYVKVFARKLDGEVIFYKDGYTDIRGKFDYVSLNTDILSTIAKFALLVVDDELGSLVQEVDPPPQ